MKKLCPILLIVLFDVLLAGSFLTVSADQEKTGTTNSGINPVLDDQTAVRKVIVGLCHAFNTHDRDTLMNYLGPNFSSFGDGSTSFVRYPKEGYVAFLLQGQYHYRVEELDVIIYGNTATTLGSISGKVTWPNNTVEEGPWGVSGFWVKIGGVWKIEHIHLSKLYMPKLKYLTQLPQGYHHDGSKKWPLLVFLHGVGERGDDLNLIKKQGLPLIAATQSNFSFVVVSPQCPAVNELTWSAYLYSLDSFLDEVIRKYSVDPDRVYLTGLSLGGYGTWAWACHSPERFAAIAPVCGGGDPAKAECLKSLPVWAFHGAKDPVVPVGGSQKMVDALKDFGGDVKLTIYPDIGHDAWTNAYNTPELYSWFMQHTRMK